MKHIKEKQTNIRTTEISEMERTEAEIRNSHLSSFSATRLQGQITIYASLSIVLVLSLIAACFKSAAVSYQKARIDAACSISLESVFANYSNELLDEFDLFGVRNDLADHEFQYLLEQNLQTNEENKTQLISQNLSDKKTLTDDNGIYLEAEVLDYIKYGAAKELIGQITDLSKQKDKAEAVEHISESVTDYSNKKIQVSQVVWDLVEKVEGIRTTQNGIVVNHGKPVPTEQAFVKEIICEEPTMLNTAIDRPEVYQTVSFAYENVESIINDMKDDITEIQQSDQEEAQDFINAYQKTYQKLYSLVNENNDATNQALQIMERYNDTTTVLQQSFRNCKSLINENRQQLGEELYQTMLDDIVGGDEDETKNDNESNDGELNICNVDCIREELQLRQDTLESIIFELDQLNLDLVEPNNDVFLERLNQISSSFHTFSNSQLKFDYSKIDFESHEDGTASIQKHYDTLKNGLTSLVLDGKGISDKSIAYTDLATNISGSGDKKENQSETEKILNNGLFGEYLIQKFSSFTDYLEEDHSVRTNTDKQLDYMLEYIICQKNSDQDNINDTILKLSGIREGINLSYLIMNTAKREEAFALAGTLLGFTGNMILIKAAQYLIMTAWAYGESIVDLKQLYQGESIPYIKSDANWNLSLENLLHMNFDTGDSELNKSTDNKIQNGLDYEQYLRVLLLIENTTKKYYGTMGAIEIRMMEMGKENFRCCNYLVYAKGTATFYLDSIKSKYERSLQSGYLK